MGAGCILMNLCWCEQTCRMLGLVLDLQFSVGRGRFGRGGWGGASGQGWVVATTLSRV